MIAGGGEKGRGIDRNGYDETRVLVQRQEVGQERVRRVLEINNGKQKSILLGK